jgi:hypothetical protein
MNFVELTSRHGHKIFINPKMVGHIYSETETGQWGGEEKGRVVTIVGMLTHNNGGFKVLETVEDVIHQIKLASIY